jgi:glycerol-3-phosphate acyltransferase PlsY
MQVLTVGGALMGAYLIGSVPVGAFIVKLVRGRDVRYWFSGRTGGTNVMRMAGFWAGLFTGIIDVSKGFFAVRLARTLMGGTAWLEVAAGLLAIVGHNYSIFLIQIIEGKIHLHGGAGGATTMGAASGLWPPAVLFMLPTGLLFLYGVGYASVATMSIALVAIIIFLCRAIGGLGPWAHVAFGVLAEGLLLWALRPNIRRLMNGEERLVGWRATRRQDQS